MASRSSPRLLAWALFASGCGASASEAPLPPTVADTASTLPTHSECLPAGETMSDETCLAVVAHDARQPNVSGNHADAPAPVPETRIDDPDYQWLTSEVERCTCVCCHRARYDGPGIHRYDLDYGPVWIDSMSDWSLTVFAGWEDLDADRMLPTDDYERLERIIQAELDRREAARQQP